MSGENRNRSRSPPGPPASSAISASVEFNFLRWASRAELLAQLEQGLIDLQDSSTVPVRSLQQAVPLVLQAAALVQAAVRADHLACLRAEQGVNPESDLESATVAPLCPASGT